MKHESAGFALIESLVAVLVLLLGIVGAIAMQTRGIAAVTEASGRAEISIAAEELIGMMWNDLPNINNYTWNGTGSPPAAYADWYNDLKTKHMPGIQVSVAVTRYGPTNQGAQVDLTFVWQPPTANSARRYAITSFISPP